MKDKTLSLAFLLILAGAGIIQAQVSSAFHIVKLVDSTSVEFKDWNAVCEVNGNTFWVVGDGGRIRKYHVDSTYTTPTIVNPPEVDISLSLPPDTSYTLCDVYFHDQSHGWIVGYKDTTISGGVIQLTLCPGPGRIWYTTSGGENVSDWHMVEKERMPLAFRQASIPCLSVDFYDDRHGYVGCGCGYVLYSNTWGQTWFALGDTVNLPNTKPPWWGVGDSIGSIPRGYGEDYYNHYGDWYWDVKARNDGKIYVASDNNGVFFQSLDDCKSWEYCCFGQDET